MKDTVLYLILQDIQTLIEKLENQQVNPELKKLITQAKQITSQINTCLEQNQEKDIYKKLLELKTLEFRIIFEEVKNTNTYKFWETLISNIKNNLITSKELQEFYKNEMNKLLMNAEIVSNILIMEDEDIVFKTFLDIIFGEAFKTYYEILQKLNNYIYTQNQQLLDEIMENIPLVIFYITQIQKLIPEEYSENVEKILEE
ncbi:MAG: hypothetical protein ABDH21_03870 [bacterium]